jgi:hypothetical protein
MTPEQFAYWLQGYAELNTQPPTMEQWDVIRAHLATVFNKVTPSIGVPPFGVKKFEPYKESYIRPDIIC